MVSVLFEITFFISSFFVFQRSAQWFCLGLSLAPLLKIEHPVDYIKSLSLLVEEYEYESSDFATQKMVRFLVSKLQTPNSNFV